ncbi:hypothetical protein [Tomitella biformata]|uniref:hypothetical protein n=1 Tax=Tomitella biformata TaxID=630403 RepID=UPI0027DDF170|nr:hypothetical protein [Tomitella biformata]
MTLSKAAGLDPDGEKITVSGSGFSGAGAGIYVGLVQDNKFSATNADVWLTQEFIRSASMTAGSWSATVDAKAVVGDSDCITNKCSIYTVAAHGSADRSQDTVTRVAFEAATTTPPTTTPPPTEPPVTTPPTTKPPTTKPPTTNPPTTKPPAGNGPNVTLSKGSGLNASGESITVRGTGFSGGGYGIYVGLAQKNQFSHTDAAVFQDAKFIKSADMSGGSWSTTLNVNSAVPNGDCLTNACAIYTLAAHGSSDRSQDTSVDVSFVGTPPRPGSGTPDGGTGGGGGTGTSGGGTGGGAEAAGGGTFASNSALTVSLSKSTGLNPGGDMVTISGSGFSGAAPGLYVGMVQDSKFSSTNADVWMTTAFLKPDAISGGSWSTTMELAAIMNGSDCMVSTCSIYTVAAHGSSDRSQDSRTPVGFLGGVAPDNASGAPAGGSGAPGGANAALAGKVGEGNSVVVEVSKAEGLDVNGETITVKGSGFSGEGAGIYVGLIQDDKFSVTDAGAWIVTEFVKAADMKDGAWTREVEVKAVMGDSDCTKNACSIYTVAAHGSSDRTQDSQTPVAFGDGVVTPVAAAASNGTVGSAGGAAEVRNLASTFSQGSTWLVLMLGAILGASVTVGTIFASRRKA